MNEKDKMIEEMAKDLKECLPNDWYWQKSVDSDTYLVAKHFYNAGYRKIPKGSVVLSKEEYFEYVELRNSEVGELVKENRKLGKHCLDWMKLYHKQLTKTNEARKEMAEEILTKMLAKAKRLKEQFNSTTYGKNKEHLIATIEIEIAGIKNLAKQFGVEVKE